MKKIDFYLLTASSKQELYLFACKLINMAYQKGHQIFIYCQNEEEALEIDELLWSFDETSFIPHNLQGEGPRSKPPIQIGFGQDCHGFHDILINLTDHVPDFFQQFGRICEIVMDEEGHKQHKRNNFRFYKENNYQIQTHTIN